MLDRSVAELIAQAALIVAERAPGSSVGVFLPVPDDLGFPEAGDHKDDPHVTVLFIGAVPDGQRDLLTKTVQEIVGGHPPLKMKIDDEVSYFDPSESSDGKRVAKLGVSAEGLEDLHKEIWEEVEAAGIEVEHSFPDFKPHITLAYIEPDESYAGEAPTGGGWTANAFELWGFGDPVELPFTAEVTAATHWSSKIKNAPAAFRDELDRLLSAGIDNAYDSVREQLSSLKVEEYPDYWERVAEEFRDGLDSDVWDEFFLDPWAAGKLEKAKAIDYQIRRVPKDLRKGLQDILKSSMAKAKKEMIDAIKNMPDLHPDYDYWWKTSFEFSVNDDAYGELHKSGQHEAAMEWVEKNVR